MRKRMILFWAVFWVFLAIAITGTVLASAAQIRGWQAHQAGLMPPESNATLFFVGFGLMTIAAIVLQVIPRLRFRTHDPPTPQPQRPALRLVS